MLAHGTTVATNALLERRLGRVALVTTRGFADVLEIARQARPSLYDARVDRPAPLVPRELRFEVVGRLDARGRELEPFDGVVPGRRTWASTRWRCACSTPTSIRRTNEPSPRVLRDAGVRRRLLARGVAGVPRVRADRDHGGRCRAALGLRAVPGARRPTSPATCSVMTSAGGLVPLADAAAHPARLLLSGPAGGVRAAAAVAAACGFPTRSPSTWAAPAPTSASCRAACPSRRRHRTVGRTPDPPAVARHPHHRRGRRIGRRASTPGGALVVGPESAGADPGPGVLRTGRRRAHRHRRRPRARSDPRRDRAPGFRSARRRRRPRRARRVPASTAEGVVAVVDAAMARAVRVVTVEQGVDPRDLALLAFGGAGPAPRVRDRRRAGHAHGRRAPARRGVLRARAPVRRPSSASWSARGPTPGSRDGLDDARRRAGRPRAAALLPGAASSTRWLDCRYAGQSHELTVRRARRLPRRARATQRVRAPGRRGRGRRAAGPGRRAAPLTVDDLPAPPRADGVGPGGGRGSRLHGVGPRRLAADAGPDRRMGGGAHVNPAELQILGSRLASIADEMGAVLRRAAFEPQHQGAGRLLGRAVHRRRRAARAGRAHPRAPRLHARVGRPPRSPPVHGRPMVLNDPFAGGTHLNDLTLVSPVALDGRARRAGSRTARTTPTSAAPRPARCHPTRSPSTRRASGCHPRRSTTRSSSGSSARVAHAGRTSGRPRRAARRQRARGRARLAGDRRIADRPRGARRDPRLRRASHARGARRAARRPLSRSRDVLDSAGPTPGAAVADAHRRDGARSTATTVTFDFTGTDPQRPGNVNAVEAVTVSAVAFALRARHRPDAAGERRDHAPGAGGRAGGHRRRRGPAGRGRCGERGGEPAGRRRVPRRARPGACPTGSAPRARAR